MNNQQFKRVIKQRTEKTRNTLISKADEYARGDRLSNFKQIAHLLNTTPEGALMGLVAKHIVALADFVNDIDRGVIQPYPRWDEKIGDIITYMHLLDAIIIERCPPEDKTALQPQGT